MTDDPEIQIALAASLDPLQQAGLMATALTVRPKVGAHRMIIHAEGSMGDCGTLGCCGIARHIHPDIGPDQISPKLLRECILSLTRRPPEDEFVAAIDADPVLREMLLPMSPEAVLSLIYKDIDAQPKYQQLLDSCTSSRQRTSAVELFIATTAAEATGEALYLTGDLLIVATCLLVWRLFPTRPLLTICQSPLTHPLRGESYVEEILRYMAPGTTRHFLFGNRANRHFIAATLRQPLSPPPPDPTNPANTPRPGSDGHDEDYDASFPPPGGRPPRSPPGATPHRPGATSSPAPSRVTSRPHSVRRHPGCDATCTPPSFAEPEHPQHPSLPIAPPGRPHQPTSPPNPRCRADAITNCSTSEPLSPLSLSTPPRFRQRCGTRRYRGFAQSPWMEEDPNLWQARLRKLHGASRAELRWILSEHPEFHRLCVLHSSERRTPAADRLLQHISEADPKFRGPNDPTIFARVLALRAPHPDPVLGLDFDLPAPSPSTPLSHAAQAVRHAVTASAPAAAAATPPPRIFCCSNGNRIRLFGKQSTGRYTTIKEWNIVLKTVSTASLADITWLMHHQWPDFHALCLQHGSNPTVSGVLKPLYQAAGGPAFLSRVCAIAPLRSPDGPSEASSNTSPTDTPDNGQNDNTSTTGQAPSLTTRDPTPNEQALWDPLPALSLQPLPPKAAEATLLLPPTEPTISFPTRGGQYVLLCDGGAQNNNISSSNTQRPAGAGFAIYLVENNALTPLRFGGAWLGDTQTNTNNIAEYQALCWGLHHAHQLHARDLLVISDSQLLVRQMTGAFGVNSPSLLGIHQRARQLVSLFDSVHITWQRRASLAVADRLANLAMTFQSSHWWCGDHPWDSAVAQWQAQLPMAPSPYVSTSPMDCDRIAPLLNSAAQVSDFLAGAIKDLTSMSAPAFRCLLSDTFGRASLPPQQLQHGSHLYNWTRTRCSSRAQRTAAPTDVFVVHIESDFDSFWCTVLLDSKLRPPNPLHRFRPAPFPNRSWVNPVAHTRGPPTTPNDPQSAAGTDSATHRPHAHSHVTPAGADVAHTTRKRRGSCDLAPDPVTPSPAVSPTHHGNRSARSSKRPCPRRHHAAQRASSSPDRPAETRGHSSTPRPRDRRDATTHSHREGSAGHAPTSRCRRPARATHHQTTPALNRLVTVKWVSPAVSARQLLEALRDANLFIPAGTYVHRGFGRVRVLEFTRSTDVSFLLSTKGAALSSHKNISINGAVTARRVSYSEQQAVSMCLRGCH